jgi:hypothetical protein
MPPSCFLEMKLIESCEFSSSSGLRYADQKNRLREDMEALVRKFAPEHVGR